MYVYVFNNVQTYHKYLKTLIKYLFTHYVTVSFGTNKLVQKDGQHIQGLTEARVVATRTMDG